MSSPSTDLRRLVGRDALVAVLDEALADLARRRGGLVVLAGEPGIGKTRLAEEAVARAGRRGVTTAWATTWAGEGAPPLWPWREVLRPLGRAEALAPDGHDGDGPDVDGPAPDGADAATRSPAAAAAARFAQADALVASLRAEAATRPLLIVLDDVQWADRASIELLVHAAPRLRDAACLVLATCRTEELPRPDVGALARVATTVAVPPLAAGPASELLAAAAGDELPGPTVAAVVARSGGNPLFVRELGQLLAQSGRRDLAPGAVPAAVAAVIERRLARLPEDAVAVLRVGAVLGGPFSIPVVAAVGGVDPPVVAAGVDAAEAVGVLVAAGAPGEVDFAHGLVRDAVVAGIDRPGRAALHARAAARFAAGLDRDPTLHAVVAGHLEQAGPEHAAAAVDHWAEAGRRAARLLAHDDAAACFARAAAGCGDAAGRIALALDEADARLRAGDLPGARDGYRAAAASAAAIEEPELLARAVLGTGTGAVAWEVPIGDEEQAASVARALALLPDDARALRSALLARLSLAAASPATMDRARARAEEALALAEEVGDAALRAQARAALCDALSGPEHVAARRRHARTIVALAEEVGDPALHLVGLRFLVVADLEVGDLAAVDDHIAAFARIAGDVREPLVAWFVPLFAGMRAALAGDGARARRSQAEVAAAAEATGSTNAHLLGDTLLLGLEVTEGATRRTSAFEGVVGLDPADWSSLAAGIAIARLTAGDRDGARRHLALFAGDGFARIGDDAEHLSTLTNFSRAAVGLGDGAACAALHDLFLPHAGLWVVDGIGAFCWGPVELELARLDHALGRHQAARDHLARARAVAVAAGAAGIVAQADALAARLDADAPPVTGAAPVAGAAPVTGAAPAEGVWCREGPLWTLGYRGRTVHLRHAKGLADLATLLARPDREVHVLDLAGARGDRSTAAVPSTADLGEVLDAPARAAYRRRLEELEDELAAADATGDPVRAERATVERDLLAHELAAALGLDGRARRAGDPVERARKAVTGRIRLAIGRVEAAHPELARHLTASVRTGTLCAYRPEVATTWRTGATRAEGDVASPHGMSRPEG